MQNQEQIPADTTARDGAFIFGFLFLWLCGAIAVTLYFIARTNSYLIAIAAFIAYLLVSAFIYNLIPDNTINDGGWHFDDEDEQIPTYQGVVVDETHRQPLAARNGQKSLPSGKKKVSAHFNDLDFDTPGVPLWMPDFVEFLNCPKCCKVTTHNQREHKGVMFYKCKKCGNVQ
jgi:predicted RNA-binding Zn-ribbon protein involved in translation (DUF1610 family)